MQNNFIILIIYHYHNHNSILKKIKLKTIPYINVFNQLIIFQFLYSFYLSIKVISHRNELLS